MSNTNQNTASTSNALPTSLFESLLPKLITVLEISQGPEGTASPQAKQALLRATNDFKHAMNDAKAIANALPGGELLIEDQDEVIAMLEQLKERKRKQLEEFSARTVVSTAPRADKMDVDSTASTPALLLE